MSFDELQHFLEQLQQLSITDADKAFAYFKEQWPQLAKDERKILSGVIEGITLRITTESNTPMNLKLCWLAIANYSEKPVIDGKVIEEDNDDIFPGLRLAEGINGNQITKLFRELKIRGVIVSSNELIAEALSIIFQIESSTANKDLTEEKRLQKVISLFP